MNATERLVEIYFRQKNHFTITDVKVINGVNRQFDILSYDPKDKQFYHIESRVGHKMMWAPNLDSLYHFMNYKFFGAPRIRAVDAPKSDFNRGKSYLAQIKQTYEIYGIEYDKIVRVWCTWCLNKIERDRLPLWKKEMAKIFKLRPQNFSIISFRDEVLPFIYDNIGPFHYEDDLSRAISLFKQQALQIKYKQQPTGAL